MVTEGQSVKNEALLKRARASEQNGKLVEAIRCYTLVIGVDSAAIDAHIGLGRIELELDRPASALEHFTRALMQRNDHIGARLGRARALLTLGNHEHALRDINFALKSVGFKTGEILLVPKKIDKKSLVIIDCFSLLTAFGEYRIAREMVAQFPPALLADPDVMIELLYLDAVEASASPLPADFAQRLRAYEKMRADDPLALLLSACVSRQVGATLREREQVERALAQEPELAYRAQALGFDIGPEGD